MFRYRSISAATLGAAALALSAMAAPSTGLAAPRGIDTGDPVRVAATLVHHKPGHGKGPGRGGGSAGHGKKAHRYGGGPPPWAPAHGYRRKQGYHYHEVDLPYIERYGLPLSLDLGRCNRETLGQLAGAAAGATIGSQIGDGRGRLAAVAAGTLIGTLLGGEIGRSMDRADRLCVDQALEHAADGQAITWSDAGGQERRQVVPMDTYQRDDGRYCREYSARSTIGGRVETTRGTACRQPDGSWQIVN